MKPTFWPLKSFCRVVPLLFAGMITWSCSPVRIISEGGSGSGTSSTSITGVVISKDGKAVAAAKVSVFKKGKVVSFLQKRQSSIDTVLTDSSGWFSIDIFKNSEYVVIAEKGEGKCLKDSIIVDTSSIDIGELSLLPVGSISGRVLLSAGHDPRTVLILIPEINRYFTPNRSDGAFSIKNMAPGNYEVCFRSNISGYDSLDTVFTIRSGKSDTLLNTIRLAYTGIQKVANAKASWDSLLLYGNLSWHSVDTLQVPIKGYNVFRSIGQNPMTLIASAIKDTFLNLDSLYFLRDSLLYFRINAVLSTGDEGAAGLCTMNIAKRAWKPTATMLWSGFSGDYYVRFMEAGFGRIFMVNQQTLGILNTQDLFDNHTGPMRRFPFNNIKGIAVNGDGFYVANLVAKSILDSGTMELFAFDSLGDSLGKKWSIQMSGAEFGMSSGVKALNNGNFYFLSDLGIDRRNAVGAPIDSLKLPSALNAIDIVTVAMSDKLLHFHAEKSMSQWQFNVITPDCVVEKSLSLPEIPISKFVANRGNATFFFVEKSLVKSGGKISYLLTERTISGGVISRVLLNDGEDLGAMFCCDEFGALYIKDAGEGMIKKYER